MSRAVYICARGGELPAIYRKKVELLNRKLTPDNIVPNPPTIIESERLIAAVINPVDSIRVKAQSICLGNMIKPQSDWWKPGSAKPDGTYALFKSNDKYIEIQSDILASRTIWYIHTPNLFIAATSQRAIIYFLEEFEPNEDAVAWMLSCGTLGPGNSWDRRIKALEPDSDLLLDRNSWKLAIKTMDIAFRPQDGSHRWFKEQLSQAIEAVFENLDLDYSKWVLTLSGGIDSRAILLMLQNVKELECVTWGRKSSQNEKLSDAYIAKQLAEHFKLDHRFMETDVSDVSFERFFNRFLVASEGRTANIAAYTDDFQIWKFFFEQGKSGILRGDNPFCISRVIRSIDVRKKFNAFRVSEYKNFKLNETLNTNEQTLGDTFFKRHDESIGAFRDRIYHQYYLPTYLMALNEIKCSFVEVMSPFLSRKIVSLARTMPVRFRTAKRLFTEIFTEKSPPIPLAEKNAIENQAQLIRRPWVVEPIIKELKDTAVKSLLSAELLHYLRHHIKINGTPDKRYPKSEGLKDCIRKIMPYRLKKFIRNHPLKYFPVPILDTNLLALRAFTVCKIVQLFNHDAQLARSFTVNNR
jgi:hypothetical protein